MYIAIATCMHVNAFLLYTVSIDCMPFIYVILYIYGIRLATIAGKRKLGSYYRVSNDVASYNDT